MGSEGAGTSWSAYGGDHVVEPIRSEFARPPDEAVAKRRMTADERRTSIVRAARREFSQSGYHGASTARIAHAAGCSEPMLYKHFAGKQALFTAVLDEVSLAMEESIDEVLTAPGCPIANWREFLPGAMHSELYAEMVGLRKLAVVLKEPAIVESLRAGNQRLVDRVTRAVERARELGTIADDVDPEYVAWIWLGITLAASYRESVAEDSGDAGFAGMLPHADRFIESLLKRT